MLTSACRLQTLETKVDNWDSQNANYHTTNQSEEFTPADSPQTLSLTLPLKTPGNWGVPGFWAWAAHSHFLAQQEMNFTSPQPSVSTGSAAHQAGRPKFGSETVLLLVYQS